MTGGFVIGEERTKVRNSNFELLRIIAMLMIVVGHLYKFWNESPEFASNSDDDIFYPWFITNQGVDIFILISGYFGIHATLKKYINLWFTLLFYAIISAVICVCVLHLPIIKIIMWPIREMFVVTSSLWFISTYFALMVFSPFINQLFNLPKESQLKYLILFLIVDVIFQTFSPGFYGLTTWGGALFHFVTLYILGRVVALWHIGVGWKISLCIYLLMSIAGYFMWDDFLYSGKDTSPWILIPSVCLLWIFMAIPSFYSKVVNYVAKSSLGVYCFHSRSAILVSAIISPLLQDIFIDFGNVFTFMAVVMLAILIYLLTIPIDFVRQKLSLVIEPYLATVVLKANQLVDNLIR